MTKFNVTAKFLDDLPSSIKAVRFEYYDRKINDVWVVDWERFVHMGKSYWCGGGDEVKTSAQVIKHMNKYLLPIYISKARVLFATKFTPSRGGNALDDGKHITLAEMKKTINK